MSEKPEYAEVWITRDGRRLRVDEMTEDHVRATLNMILRARRKARKLTKSLQRLNRWIEEADSDNGKWGRS